MSTSLNDPMGQAILDFSRTKESKDITVVSKICEDDVIPSEYLFRSFSEMPKLEQLALQSATGKILDVGAGAGTHVKYLKDKGLDVFAIDTSQGSVEYLKSIDISCSQIDFLNYSDGDYDTILMLMNGIGIAGKLSNLGGTLIHAWDLLSSNGRLIFDSCDIKYLFQNDDESMWVDLTSEYYGDFEFQMIYGEHASPWFNWLYVDFERMRAIAEKVGFKVTKLAEENDEYLAELRKP